jgi:hypothetical protein
MRRHHATVLSTSFFSFRWFGRFQLVTGRVWRGSAFGGVKGRTELPGIVEGQIPIHRYATPRMSFFFTHSFLLLQITWKEKSKWMNMLRTSSSSRT